MNNFSQQQQHWTNSSHNNNHNYPNSPVFGDFNQHYESFFEKPLSNEMHQLIEKDKINHHLYQHNNKNEFENNLVQDPIIPILNDKYQNKHDLDYQYFPNKAVTAQKPWPLQHSNRFDFSNQPKHKLLVGRGRGKRRFRKQQKRRRPQTDYFHPPPPFDTRHQSYQTESGGYDAFLDLDYIEEMFAGHNDVDDDSANHNSHGMYPQKPMHRQPEGKYNGYSMIEETDLDFIDRYPY